MSWEETPYTEEEIKTFAPADLKQRAKSKPLDLLRVEYGEGKGAPILQEPILQFVSKQKFKNRWVDAMDTLEKVLTSGPGPYKVFCEPPQDYRGIFMIKAWRE